MEVYILDSLYRRIDVIEDHESMIWTERVATLGDFEFHLRSTLQNRSRFKAGVLLAQSDSYRVMKVETVEDNTNAEGIRMLKVTGHSLEVILDDRVARSALSDLTTLPKWSLTGYPAAIAREIFHDICVTGVLDTGDIISGITEGSSLFPTSTIPEPADSVTVQIDLTTVYQALSQLCQVYDMGFRLVRDPNTGSLYFDVYTGCDRTTQQTTLSAVVFSPSLDNLQNTTELTTISGAKNVAYVFSPVGHRIVYATDVDPSVAGFDRHVLLVNASDITDTTPSVANAKMDQKGREELAKARSFSGFDGEISQYGTYKYGVDYNLGDLVEKRNSDGIRNNMRVTEQIFISDREGSRSYPTLSLAEYITPGSWAAYDPSKAWFDLDSDTTDVWSNQP
jgi:hypothetical protein